MPKRLKAITMAHRSAAKYGQNSAPMNSSSGFPAEVSFGWPLSTEGGVTPDPIPTVAASAGVTPVTSDTTCADAATGGGRAEVLVVGVLDPPRTLAKTNTKMITTTMPMEAKARVEGEKRRGGGAVICILGLAPRPLAPPAVGGRPLPPVGGRPLGVAFVAGGRLVAAPLGAGALGR